MEKLARYNPHKVIDFLSERLTFERAGVRLYDAILEKLKRVEDTDVERMIEPMTEHRDQEQEHVEWLQRQIANLGGDTGGRTEMAELVTRESQGIEDVILDGDNDISHLFHALLTAELTDNAGWDMLVSLADEAGDREAKRELKHRLHEEEEHLVFVRRVLEGFARREVLGEDVALPVWP
jgi:bacterioferritin (cytochrome b1)